MNGSTNRQTDMPSYRDATSFCAFLLVPFRLMSYLPSYMLLNLLSMLSMSLSQIHVPSCFSQFKLDSSELQQLEEEESSSDVEQQVLRSTAKRLPIANRTMAGNVRYCERCRAVKPDR